MASLGKRLSRRQVISAFEREQTEHKAGRMTSALYDMMRRAPPLPDTGAQSAKDNRRLFAWGAGQQEEGMGMGEGEALGEARAEEEGATMLYFRSGRQRARHARRDGFSRRGRQLNRSVMLGRVLQRMQRESREASYLDAMRQARMSMRVAREMWKRRRQQYTQEEVLRKVDAELERQAEAEFEQFRAATEMAIETGARLPFLSEEHAVTIERWRRRLRAMPYEDMSIAERALLDHFLQVNLLRWADELRQHRMQDVSWYFYYTQFRNAIFPEIDLSLQRRRHVDASVAKRAVSRFRKMPEHIFEHAPFFYEDYAEHFHRMKESDFANWEGPEQSAFFKWAMHTLVGRWHLQDVSDAQLLDYIEEVRLTFFPLAQVTHRASLELPTPQEMRQILFDNNIGYKTDKATGKLYIKRFYKIPGLLFPEAVQNELLARDAEMGRKFKGDTRGGTTGGSASSSLHGDIQRASTLAEKEHSSLQDEQSRQLKADYIGELQGREKDMSARATAAAQALSRVDAIGDEAAMQELERLLADPEAELGSGDAHPALDAEADTTAESDSLSTIQASAAAPSSSSSSALAEAREAAKQAMEEVRTQVIDNSANLRELESRLFAAGEDGEELVRASMRERLERLPEGQREQELTQLAAFLFLREDPAGMPMLRELALRFKDGRKDQRERILRQVHAMGLSEPFRALLDHVDPALLERYDRAVARREFVAKAAAGADANADAAASSQDIQRALGIEEEVTGTHADTETDGDGLLALETQLAASGRSDGNSALTGDAHSFDKESPLGLMSRDLALRKQLQARSGSAHEQRSQYALEQLSLAEEVNRAQEEEADRLTAVGRTLPRAADRMETMRQETAKQLRGLRRFSRAQLEGILVKDAQKLSSPLPADLRMQSVELEEDVKWMRSRLRFEHERRRDALTNLTQRWMVARNRRIHAFLETDPRAVRDMMPHAEALSLVRTGKLGVRNMLKPSIPTIPQSLHAYEVPVIEPAAGGDGAKLDSLSHIQKINRALETGVIPPTTQEERRAGWLMGLYGAGATRALTPLMQRMGLKWEHADADAPTLEGEERGTGTQAGLAAGSPAELFDRLSQGARTGADDFQRMRVLGPESTTGVDNTDAHTAQRHLFLESFLPPTLSSVSGSAEGQPLIRAWAVHERVRLRRFLRERLAGDHGHPAHAVPPGGDPDLSEPLASRDAIQAGLGELTTTRLERLRAQYYRLDKQARARVRDRVRATVGGVEVSRLFSDVEERGAAAVARDVLDAAWRRHGQLVAEHMQPERLQEMERRFERENAEQVYRSAVANPADAALFTSGRDYPTPHQLAEVADLPFSPRPVPPSRPVGDSLRHVVTVDEEGKKHLVETVLVKSAQSPTRTLRYQLNYGPLLQNAFTAEQMLARTWYEAEIVQNFPTQPDTSDRLAPYGSFHFDDKAEAWDTAPADGPALRRDLRGLLTATLLGENYNAGLNDLSMIDHDGHYTDVSEATASSADDFRHKMRKAMLEFDRWALRNLDLAGKQNGEQGGEENVAADE